MRVILELAFEDGFTGISESPCTDGVNESLELVCQGLHGEDPVQLTRLLEKAKTLIEVDETRGDAPWDQRVWVHVQSALEVACLDYFGKRFGVRMCDLLGGAARDTVPYGAYLFYKLEGAGGGGSGGEECEHHCGALVAAIARTMTRATMMTTTMTATTTKTMNTLRRRRRH